MKRKNNELKGELSKRQEQILRAVIELFITTGKDISSFELKRAHKFDFSSATLRNEFLVLTKSGYLVKSHFASGRFPTSKGLRYFIAKLMQEEEPDFYELVELSHKLFDSRFNIQNLLSLAMKELYKNVSNSVFVLYNGVIQFYRLSKILKDVDKLQVKLRPKYLAGFAKLLDVIEDAELLEKILKREYANSLRGVGILSGSKLGWDELESFVFVFAPFRIFTSDENIGFIGTLGYLNQNYPVIVPAVRSMSEMLTNLLKGW